MRMPNPISDEYLKKEDEFLHEYFKQFKLVDITEISTISDKSKLVLYQGDITKIKIDSIVNPANEQGLGCFRALHSCLDNQITSFAGLRLRLEDKKQMDKLGNYLGTGEVFITKGYNLPAKNVIHTVGPIIDDKVHEYQKEQLKACYINSLEIAKKNNIRTIAFPSISTGVFRFPKELASRLAIDVIKDYLKNNESYFDKVVLVAYTKEDFEYYKKYI